jgi:hypothetical protein
MNRRRNRCGRVGRLVRRRLIIAAGPVPFAELMATVYAGRRPWRVPIYRALKRFGQPVRKGYWTLRVERRDG